MKIIFISTYPPRRCGIATFTQDLLNSIKLIAPSITTEVYALNTTATDTRTYPAEVKATINQDEPESYILAANKINKQGRNTIVVVQHEYGIHGGKAGKNLLALLERLNYPVITTFHTVLAEPAPYMEAVTGKLINFSDEVVVLTNNSAEIIRNRYPQADSKLTVIPHGIHPLIYTSPSKVKPRFNLEGRQVLLTFGLLSRNKGIEYVLKGLPEVVKLYPKLMYLVVGHTHPEVLREEGQAYRNELTRLVRKLGLTKNVLFVDEYTPVNTLLAYLQAADIYMATSLDPQQAVSGTLSYALGAGCAIVATDFSQAREVLGAMGGKIVPFRDPEAISRAIISLFNDPARLSKLRLNAYLSTRTMLWSNVADNYLSLTSSAKTMGDNLPEIRLDHLIGMTSEFGIYQFANNFMPNLSHGFTLDDNSRALQLMLSLSRHRLARKQTVQALAAKYLNGIKICLDNNPPVNYLSAKGRPTAQNKREDINDSFGRAFYALQETSRLLGENGDLGTSARRLLNRLPLWPPGDGLRTAASYVLGYAASMGSDKKTALPALKIVADNLANQHYRKIKSGWSWFEPHLTYANGSLCTAMLEAAMATDSKAYAKIGLETLDFLINQCFMGEVYVPIGHDGWYEYGKKRSMFAQQPEDPFAMVQALVSAYRLTADSRYKYLARKAFSWYLGNNLLGIRMYDDETGGCFDGLRPSGANPNQGAESSVAYLRARLLIEQLG